MRQIFSLLMALTLCVGTAGACIKKAKGERLEAKGDDLKWEVDVFHGRLEGRVLAEIELSDEDAEIRFPKEIAVIKEVTDDESYKNAALAKIQSDEREALL